MKSAVFVLLTGCTTALTIQSNAPDTTVYITDQLTTPQAPPTFFEASGTAPVVCTIDYYAWEKYYIWADAPGYQAQVIPISNEVKVPQAIGAACCFLPLAIWAYGPVEGPITIQLVPDRPVPSGSIPVYNDDGEIAGYCEVPPAGEEL